ncbi:MAG: hypothetical protein P8183_16005 [Anaerolineae bacterium]
MAKQTTAVENNEIHTLWLALTAELANVFDAHGVCAAIANTIAIHTGTTTVIGISGPQRRYYDV